MKSYGKYTADEILKGLMYEMGKAVMKVSVLSIEAAKNSPLYGSTGLHRQSMALDIEVNTDMANGNDEIIPLLTEIAQQNMEGAP